MLRSVKERPQTSAAADFSKASAGRLTAAKRKNKHPSPLTLRMSDTELAAVKADAERGGVSVSAHVRSKVFGKSGRRGNMPVKDREALGRLLGLLGQSEFAESLKQIASEAEQGSLLLDEETERKIEEAFLHVCFMREALVAALGLRERGFE